MQLNRREFIKYSQSLALALGLPLQTSKSFAAAPSSGPLEENVVQSVKALLAGEKPMLTLLLPEGSESNLRPIVARFKERTGVEVRLETTGVDEVSTSILLGSTSSGLPFDLALPATFAIPELVEADAIADVTELARSHEPSSLRDGMLYVAGDTYKQKFYGYQTDGDAYVLFFLESLLADQKEQRRYFETFGVQLELPRTWEDLDRQIQFFHRPKQNQFGGALFRTANYLVWEWWLRFHSKGYFPFDDAFQAQINNDSGVEALEELIAVTQYLSPGAKSNGLFANWDEYSAGNVYCNIGWGGTQKALRKKGSKVRMNLRHGLTPGIVQHGKHIPISYFNWGWNYVICRESKQKELAYLFSLFASLPKSSTEAVRQQQGFFDPYRREHYEDPQIQEIYSSSFLEVHQRSMTRCIPDLYVQGQGEYMDALREALRDALAGKMTPKVALDSAASSWRLITRRIGSAKQAKRWQELKGLYPSDLRAVLV